MQKDVCDLCVRVHDDFMGSVAYFVLNEPLSQVFNFSNFKCQTGGLSRLWSLANNF